MPPADASGGARARYRSTAMDRVFADARIIALTGPTTGLDPRIARDVMNAAERSSDTPRLALEPHEDSRDWDYRTGEDESTVIALPDLDTTDLGALLTDIRNRPGPKKALEVVVCGDYLAVDLSHGIGDGQMGLMLMAAFSSDVDDARARGLATGLPDGSTWTALRRHYSAKPAALRDFWRLRKEHKSSPSTDGVSTRTIENWESAKVSRSAYMDPGRVSELREWASTNAVGATSASISVALWRAALEAQNVPLSEQVMILFNSRRYLGPEHLASHGNFAVGIPLHLPRNSTPVAIAATMKQVIDSGWPVAILGMSEIKDKLLSWRSRGDAPAGNAVIDVPDRVRLAVSDLGKLRMFDHLQWADDGRPPQIAASLEPDGPDGMTMLIAEVAGGRTYTASFCDRMIDSKVVESALENLCADPLSLLRDVRA
ncbi:hypothetical protein [Rhodococcoides kyotonense]|uniref:Condensation domain-containing protein n=1 Tax=Rhodococcoides kyotonense TaxID=398843 RepID=A0A239H9U7_9NOCA|nr:hypothetical protein [Rhodococcus kyotonensis]SNS78206.1 hypothetical protein SAMN05421642_105164 [Rhodococcus kyotonensis]